MAQLELNNVVMRYGAHEALKGISATVDSGEFIVVVGPSGCGKSSLLRAIAGLERITSGDILLDGSPIHNVPAAKRGLAMVFQSYALYPQKTVAQNMAFALQMAKASKDEIERRVADAARILQVEELLDRKPGQLSGGQRQRVAIGRAIVREPKVFLFDEPLSNLDAALRVDMRVELASLHKSLSATMIYVTHDQVEAMTMADRVIVLNQGEVAQIGAPLELYEKPKDLFVAGFIGSPKMNFVPGTVDQVDGNSLAVSICNGAFRFERPIQGAKLESGESLTTGIRPESIELSDATADPHLNFKVSLVEHLGDESIVYGTLDDGQRLVVKTAKRADWRDGETIKAVPDPEKIHLFGKDGLAITG